MLGPDARWTDVQSVDIGGRESFRVRQYRRADDTRVVPGIAATALTLDDVKEASTKVSPRALEAALVETRASFNLSSKRLLELQNAGVPASVVDLMVALSYPDRFVIERTASVDRARAPIIDDPFMLGWAFGFPMWSDVYGFYSPLYGPYSPYYYSPFAYPYYRGYNPYYYGGGYYGGGYYVDTGGGGGGGGNLPDRPSGLGRVVDGQGYTRVRARESDPVTPRSGGGSTASSTGGSGGGGAASSSGSSGGGSSASPAGFSSGGGGDGGGRSAQPR
jgi:hypothetical protein